MGFNLALKGLNWSFCTSELRRSIKSLCSAHRTVTKSCFEQFVHVRCSADEFEAKCHAYALAIKKLQIPSKTNVRPVLTYASETRAETTYTQQLLWTTEMKIIREIHGKTLRDKIRSDQLWQLSGIQGIIKWANVRRREWDGHVERMEDNHLAKIARENEVQPSGKDR
jgi:hypothetical protein